jgi:hypothetical protein
VVNLCTYKQHLLVSAWTITILAEAVLISFEQCQTNGLSAWDGVSSRWGWERRPTVLQGICEYSEQAVANGRQGMVFQLEGWTRS